MERISIYSNMEETDRRTARQISECKEVICNANQNDRASLTKMDRNKSLSAKLKIFQNCTNAIRLPQCEAVSLPSLVVHFDNVQSNLVPAGISVMVYLIKFHGSPGRLFGLTIILVLVGMMMTRFECTGDYQAMRRLHGENLEILKSLLDRHFHRPHPVLEVTDDQYSGNWIFKRCFQFLLSLFSSLYVKYDKI